MKNADNNKVGKVLYKVFQREFDIEITMNIASPVST